MRTASTNGSSGLSAIADQTTTSQIMPSRSSSRMRCHSDAFGRVGLRGGGPAAAGGSAGGASPSCTVGVERPGGVGGASVMWSPGR